jgi:hypothetical protein
MNEWKWWDLNFNTSWTERLQPSSAHIHTMKSCPYHKLAFASRKQVKHSKIHLWLYASFLIIDLIIDRQNLLIHDHVEVLLRYNTCWIRAKLCDFSIISKVHSHSFFFDLNVWCLSYITSSPVFLSIINCTIGSLYRSEPLFWW